MHRLAVDRLPAKKSIAVAAPQDPRARHVAVDGERMVYVAPGPRGITLWQELQGVATELFVGTADAQPTTLLCAHGRVLCGLVDARGAPSRVRAVQVIGGPAVPGQVFAVAAHAPVAVVVDVPSRAISRVDLSTSEVRTVASLPQGGADVQTPGLVHVAADGSRALVVDFAEMHRGAALYDVDLGTGALSRVHGPLTAAGWIVGGIVGKKVAVLEMNLEAERARLLHGGVEVLALPGAQPMADLVAVDASVVACLLAPQIDALTGTGASQLCVVDTAGGAWAALCEAGDARRVRLDTVGGPALLLEGGRRVARVQM